MSCAALQLITILTGYIYIEDQALVRNLSYHPRLGMVMAVVLAQPRAEFGGWYGQGRSLKSNLELPTELDG